MVCPAMARCSSHGRVVRRPRHQADHKAPHHRAAGYAEGHRACAWGRRGSPVGTLPSGGTVYPCPPAWYGSRLRREGPLPRVLDSIPARHMGEHTTRAMVSLGCGCRFVAHHRFPESSQQRRDVPQLQGDIAVGEAMAKARATRSRSDCGKASLPLGFLLAALCSRKLLIALRPSCRLVTDYGAARGHEASAVCGDASTPLHSTARGGAEAGWR